MARVTVEDCVEKVPNRFELVMLAGQRARDISSGARPSVDRDNDKNPVIALREIAEETVNLESLRNALVSGLQKQVDHDEPEQDDIDILGARDLLVEAGGETIDDSADAEDDGLSIHDAADIDPSALDDL